MRGGLITAKSGVPGLNQTTTGLGLDRRHIGAFPRTALQTFLPKTLQRVRLVSLQSAPPRPLPQRFAHDLAAGGIVAALHGFTHDRQHFRRQRNTHLFDIGHDKYPPDSGNVWGREPHPDDLPRGAAEDEFLDKLTLALRNQRHATRPGGYFGAIVGDVRRGGQYFSYQADLTRVCQGRS
jgi:hypothetical protein